MVFNDASTNQGICQDARGLLGLGVNDTSSYPTADIVRSSNNWYRRAVNWIWQTVGDWEYDDTNATSLPIAVTDLVDSQSDYELPSGAQAVERVEIEDSDSNWVLLKPITKEQIKDEAMTEQFEENGLPIYYDMVGRSIILYPTPSDSEVTTSGGLKIYVSRDIEEFTVSSTSTEPGFANNFHRIIPLGCASDYANARGMTDKIGVFNSQIASLQTEMKEFYARRHERDFKLKIKPSTTDFV